MSIRTIFFSVIIAAATITACDDSTDLSPAPHDAGAEGGDAAPEAGDAALTDAPIDAPDGG